MKKPGFGYRVSGVGERQKIHHEGTKNTKLHKENKEMFNNQYPILIPVQKPRFFGIADDHVRKTRFIKPYFAELVIGDPVK